MHMICARLGRYGIAALWSAGSGLLAGLLVLTPIEAGGAAQEAKLLFSPVPATADLNEDQARVLARIKDSPATVPGTVQVVRVETEALAAAKSSLALALSADTKFDIPPGARKQKLPSKGVKGDAGMRLAWTDKGGNQSVSLSLTDKTETQPVTANGLIYADKKMFAVEPLGDGLQAIIQLDQTKYEDHPKIFGEIEKTLGSTPKRDVYPKSDGQPDPKNPPVVITVLVAYTPKVESMVSNVNALINAAVDDANLSYVHSQISLRLKLVDTVKVQYTEAGAHEVDLDRFMKNGDGFMDNIHKRRKDTQANICILLIDNKQYCGLAAAILATEDTAFAVVHYDCAVKNRSFMHEIGHLQGARHDLDVDKTVDPLRPYNHGYLSQRDWRTIMAYPTNAQPNRLLYWSNPKVNLAGDPMGTVAKHDNARVLNETALMISKFR